jgi:serine/threonine protein kinase
MRLHEVILDMARVVTMASESTCPGREELVAFVGGRLDSALLERIGDHIGNCIPCAQLVAGLEQSDASVLSALRALAGLQIGSETPECQRMQARARAIRISQPDHAGDTARTPNAVSGGIRLGQYQLLRKIGGGGMGVVYRALHIHLNRCVALKVISSDLTSDVKAIARFRREMAAVGKLDHPNVVRAMDAGEVNGRHFLAMELVDGVDLSRLVKSMGPLTVGAACEIVRQAALGLTYIHRHQMVHRDIKPSNLIVTSDGTVKILDLGLAQIGGERFGTDLTGNDVIGTLDYIAPEQVVASGNVDIRADLYSLGCTFYRLLTGQAPFSGAKYEQTRAKICGHANDSPPAIETVRTDVPVDVNSVLGRLMAKAPDDRLRTPEEVVEALTPFAQLSEVVAVVSEALSRSPVEVRAETDLVLPGIRIPEGTTESVLKPQSEQPLAPKRLRRYLAIVSIVATALLTTTGLMLFSHRLVPPSDKEPVLEPGVWNPLMIRAPTKTRWADLIGDSNLEFKPDRQELWVNSTGEVLLGFGKLECASYRLQVLIRQVKWTGGVGVYLGYRRDAANEGRVTYQSLSLNEAPNNNMKFSRNRVVVNDDNITESAVTSAEEIVPTPDTLEAVLELVVIKNRLQRVRWNGTDLPKLTSVDADRKFTAADYSGEIGIFNRLSAGVYRNFQVMPSLEDN